MRIIISLIFGMLLLYACSTGTGNSKALTGSQIYKIRCATCHGADGRMGMNGAKVLPLSPLNKEQRMEVIRKGQNIMPAFQGLMSKEEIEAVAAYTMELK